MVVGQLVIINLNMSSQSSCLHPLLTVHHLKSLSAHHSKHIPLECSASEKEEWHHNTSCLCSSQLGMGWWATALGVEEGKEELVQQSYQQPALGRACVCSANHKRIIDFFNNRDEIIALQLRTKVVKCEKNESSVVVGEAHLGLFM